MSEETQCPGLESLQQLCHGQLSEQAAAWLRQHLSSCSTCSATLQTLRTKTKTRPVEGADRTKSLNMDALLQSAGRYEFLSPPQQEGELGRLGPYRIFKLLGEGGMGMV